MRVAKTKALISFAVTAKLICVFVFAYADCWFSHEAAQMKKKQQFWFSTWCDTNQPVGSQTQARSLKLWI